MQNIFEGKCVEPEGGIFRYAGTWELALSLMVWNVAIWRGGGYVGKLAGSVENVPTDMKSFLESLTHTAIAAGTYRDPP